MPTTGSWCQRRWTDSLSGPDVHKLCTFTNSLRKYYTPKSELPVPYSVFHSQHHALAETCQGMSWRIRRILIDHHQDIARANTSLAMWARVIGEIRPSHDEFPLTLDSSMDICMHSQMTFTRFYTFHIRNMILDSLKGIAVINSFLACASDDALPWSGWELCCEKRWKRVNLRWKLNLT